MKKIKNKIKIILENLYIYFTFRKVAIKEVNIEDDKKFINLLAKKYDNFIKEDDNLKSYFYRSFLQYKCQMYGVSFANKFIINLFSVIILPLFTIALVISNFFVKNKKKPFVNNNKIAVLVTKTKKDLIPKSLSIKYEIIVSYYEGFILDEDGLRFLKIFIEKFYFYPYFILKSLLKISLYNYVCFKYVPAAIVASLEYSFTSSVLTAYLERKNISHINIMHGERLFDIHYSFFRFSECWTWQKHYINLFKKLFAYKNQFRIEFPPRHEKLRNIKISCNNKKILKFYWASEVEKKELRYIFQGLNKLKNRGFKVIIRYHPSHKDLFFRTVSHYLDNFVVEDPENKNIYDSLTETYYVLSTYSTVLYEANLMRRVIVINDYKNNLSELKRLDYILLKNRRYIPFSKLVEECKFM